jgi:hypothetical protein
MSGISPQQKKDPQEKKGSKDWKEKEVKPQLKSSIFWEKKRREDEVYMLLGEILSKERKKGDHIFL